MWKEKDVLRLHIKNPGDSFLKKVTSFTGVVVWLLVVSLLAGSVHLMSK